MKQSDTTNRQFVLAERPEGTPTESTLTLKTEDIPAPKEGEMLLRTVFLSLDPYMRGRMSDAPSYAAWFRNTTPPAFPKVPFDWAT